jgi:hypothetical protein
MVHHCQVRRLRVMRDQSNREPKSREKQHFEPKRGGHDFLLFWGRSWPSVGARTVIGSQTIVMQRQGESPGRCRCRSIKARAMWCNGTEEGQCGNAAQKSKQDTDGLHERLLSWEESA